MVRMVAWLTAGPKHL